MQQPIIFINHRRTDAGWPANFLAAKLSAAFGKERVFQDVRNIQAGDDLSDEILENLARTTVLLVLIGIQWLTAQDKHGRRRLDKEDDWVRREIRFGLEKADCKVIPVLLDEAALPDEAEALPADIRGLLKPKWLQIRQANGDDDVEVLIRVIRDSGFQGKAEDPRDRQLLAEELLNKLMPGEFRSVLLHYQISENELPAQVSPRERIIAAIQYATTTEGKELNQLIESIYRVAPRLKR